MPIPPKRNASPTLPGSLAVHEDILYGLSDGGSGNIIGFTLSLTGNGQRRAFISPEVVVID
jgi:hypothetical protein